MGFLKGLVKTITGIIAVVICIVIFVLEMGIHVVVDTKGFLSKDNMVKIVKNVDINFLLEDENGHKTDLAKDMYKNAEEAGISSEAIDKLINSNSFREAIGKYVGSSVESIIYGTDVEKPTADDIVKIVEDNMDIIYKVAAKEGKTLTNADKEEILSEIRKGAPEIIDELPDISSELKADDEEAIEIVQNVYDSKYLLLAIGAIIVLAGLIALLRFNLYSWMMWISIPTIISSIIFIGFSFVPSVIITILETTDVSKNIIDFVANDILSSLFTRFLISGIIGLVISIVLIVFYSIINKKKKHKVVDQTDTDMAVLE